ncbi:membrane protein insertion efficiency factor YidD [bacterium]|nr:membrane protein insertion efficiency factor YidD [candidate division CSSED10-310 bacterium]
MRWLVIGIIQLYKSLISPILPEACRFTPTCSEYTMTAVARYGIIRGLFLGFKRIIRCHPWNPGGHDPVP